MALEDGLIHSESLLLDAPQSFDSYRPGNFDKAFNGPIGAAEALRLSLNVPAVELLNRVGPMRFAARLQHAGLALKFPAGAAPNLSMILGGTGAKLEDMVGTFAALHRGGIAGHVRYTPVSYTHLDVYKRQTPHWPRGCASCRKAKARITPVWMWPVCRVLRRQPMRDKSKSSAVYLAPTASRGHRVR